MAEKCVFLDRDGTIIEDTGYLNDPADVRLLPGADVALRSLADAGFKLVVVTNQSGIARGTITEDQLGEIHAEVRRQLADRGAHVDEIYYCPYHPEGSVKIYTRESEDRKPAPGMLLRAAEELDVDLSQSWMVGDTPSDVEAGRRAGCRTVRIRLKGESPATTPEGSADYVVRNVVDAARVILRESGIGALPRLEDAREDEGDTAWVSPPTDARLEEMSATELLREIVRHLRTTSRPPCEQRFSAALLAGTVFQILAIIALVVAVVYLPGSPASYDSQVRAYLTLLTAGVLQGTALTFFYLSGRR